MNLAPCSCNSTNAQPFDHFLLTRFSVPRPRGDMPPEEWFARRFDLFETFCVPSVRDQACHGFRWGLLVGSSTPTWVIDRLLSLGFPETDLVVTEEWRGGQALQQWLTRFGERGRVLTSRIDSDDALAHDYVSRLHAKLSHQVNTAYNFPRGLQLTPSGLLRVRSVTGPFVSLLSDYSAAELSVLGYDHDTISRVIKTTQLGGGPAWLQVIHNQNLSNVPDGIPTWPNKYQDQFSVPLPRGFYSPIKYLRDVRIAPRLAVRTRRFFRDNLWARGQRAQ